MLALCKGLQTNMALSTSLQSSESMIERRSASNIFCRLFNWLIARASITEDHDKDINSTAIRRTVLHHLNVLALIFQVYAVWLLPSTAFGNCNSVPQSGLQSACYHWNAGAILVQLAVSDRTHLQNNLPAPSFQVNGSPAYLPLPNPGTFPQAAFQHDIRLGLCSSDAGLDCMNGNIWLIEVHMVFEVQYPIIGTHSMNHCWTQGNVPTRNSWAADMRADTRDCWPLRRALHRKTIGRLSAKQTSFSGNSWQAIPGYLLLWCDHRWLQTTAILRLINLNFTNNFHGWGDSVWSLIKQFVSPNWRMFKSGHRT